MRTIDELGISQTPWKAEDNLKSFPLSSCSVRCDVYDVAQNVLPSDARLIAAAPELLAFAIAYYKANKKNAVKVNPNNGDKFQNGLMLMCKVALVKAGTMDYNEAWDEEVTK